MAEDEFISDARIIVERSDQPIDEIIRHAAENDLLILRASTPGETPEK
ncbi:MAG: hypothetical protein R2860_07505 [Desulfobacterales bacterium]